MRALRIEGTTRVLGAPREWVDDGRSDLCGALAIRDIVDPELGPEMVSAWELTDNERAALIAGAPIYLTICGNIHPPIALRVGNPPKDGE